MTATLTDIVLQTLRSMSYDALSTRFGALVAVLLLVLLASRELVRHLEPRGNATWLQAFDIVSVPLLLAFGFVILMRLVDLL